MCTCGRVGKQTVGKKQRTAGELWTCCDTVEGASRKRPPTVSFHSNRTSRIKKPVKTRRTVVPWATLVEAAKERGERECSAVDAMGYLPEYGELSPFFCDL